MAAQANKKQEQALEISNVWWNQLQLLPILGGPWSIAHHML